MYDEFLDVERKTYNKKEFKPIEPFFVYRYKAGNHDCMHKVERFEIAREELHKAEGIEDCFIQRYIRSARKKKPKMIR